MATVLLAVGDMAGPSDNNSGSAATAALVKSLLATNPGSALLVLGDNAYDNGTTQEYAERYASSWGDSAIKPPSALAARTTFLEEDLAAHQTAPTIAFFHRRDSARAGMHRRAV